MTTTLRIGEYKIKGPDYFADPECRAMAELLVQRGVSGNSIPIRMMKAHAMWVYAQERLGVTDIHTVTADTIASIAELRIADGIGEKTVRGDMSDFGTMVLASTGANPYVGNLVKSRKQTLEERLEPFIVSCRFGEQLRPYVADMLKCGLKELTVYDNITVAARALNRLDELIGTNYILETVGIDELLAYRMATTVSERSCKREVEILCRFIRFATGRNPLRANLLWNVSDEDAPNRKFISEEQWRTLIEDVDPQTYLILCLGGAMGLRRAEISGIMLTDIEGNVLRIRGKGHGPEGKVIHMTMPEVVMKALYAYMVQRQECISLYGDGSDGYLMISLKKGRTCRMMPDAVNRIVKRLGDERGVDLTVHSLRRLFATTMHDSGVDDDTLRRMMRHTNITTTLTCYLNADPRRLAGASDAVVERLFA